MNSVTVKVVYRSSKGLYVLRWQDLETRSWRERSAKTNSKKEAMKLAAQLEADLQQGRFVEPSKTLWEEFRLAFQAEKLSAMALRTRQSYQTALDRLETVLRPQKLIDVDSASLSRFQNILREAGLREATIANYLRHVKAAFNWAHEIGMLVQVPKFQKLKRARTVRRMRGRPITKDELERMRRCCVLVRPDDCWDWQDYLEGLWLSGLRLGESLKLSWDIESAISIDLSGTYPVILISAEAEKGFRDRRLPITPDFGAFLNEIGSEARHGHVFAVAALGLRLDTVSKIVSRIGQAANVVVNKSQKKFASAHDLRRSFGTRWAGKLKPIDLQLLMRHESIETTLKYYVDQDVADVSARIWEEARPSEVPGT